MKGARPRGGLGRVTAAAACLLLAAAGAAAQDADDAALQLADRTPQAAVAAHDLRAYLEGSLGFTRDRPDDAVAPYRRGSLDVREDTPVGGAWRLVFADRVDAVSPVTLGGTRTVVNTIKDAYASWQPRASTIVDLGRINAHDGAGLGYNPSDYFRQGAVRSLVSVDPLSTKENRQGSVMLRTQNLWDGGSLTAIASPRLASTEQDASWNPDWGATNSSHRFVLLASQRLADGFAPQLVLEQTLGKSTQAGANLTALLGDAGVAYLEYSGGRAASQLDQALARAGLAQRVGESFFSRVVAGATATTEDKLSLTLEYQFDQAAVERASWTTLFARSAPAYVAYRLWVLDARELPTQRAVLANLSWVDGLVRRLDWHALEDIDLEDHSRLSWIELRYRFERAELAVQWQRNSGSRLSDFGVQPQQSSLIVLARAYFP